MQWSARRGLRVDATGEQREPDWAETTIQVLTALHGTELYTPSVPHSRPGLVQAEDQVMDEYMDAWTHGRMDAAAGLDRDWRRWPMRESEAERTVYGEDQGMVGRGAQQDGRSSWLTGVRPGERGKKVAPERQSRLFNREIESTKPAAGQEIQIEVEVEVEVEIARDVDKSAGQVRCGGGSNAVEWVKSGPSIGKLEEWIISTGSTGFEGQDGTSATYLSLLSAF
ncbi:hypothetical protein F4801DRAFT_583504 [Xylaria longipes]|nr:hypothetical protein F4801DRAFT_583504 [Xylaria longipes]